METGDIIRVRFVGLDNPIALRHGKVYKAVVLKPTRKGTHWYGIVDETYEEYAYPPELFEILSLTVPDIPLFAHVRVISRKTTGIVVDVFERRYIVEDDIERPAPNYPDENAYYGGKWPLYTCFGNDLELLDEPEESSAENPESSRRE